MKAYFLNVPFAAIQATPSAPVATPTGTDNGVTRAYKVVGIDAEGNHGIASAAGTNAHGATTQDSSNYETITWTDPPGAAFVDVYRTTGAVTGKIGRVAAGVQTLADTGLVGDGTTAPTTDTSGVGAAVAVGNISNVGVQFAGTFTATIQLQGTLNGSDWFSVGSAATGAATVVPLSILLKLRAKCTAYTSGTPAITAGGHAW
jgi:hypothetical protein